MDRTVKVLVEYGADPNEEYCGETVWRRFLRTYNLHNADKPTSDDTKGMRIIHRLFISDRADKRELDAARRDLQPE
jgi:hypothetical protein